MAISDTKIISVVVGLFLAGVLMPIGLDKIYSANTTNWDSTVATIFTVLMPVLAVLGLGLAFYKKR